MLSDKRAGSLPAAHPVALNFPTIFAMVYSAGSSSGRQTVPSMVKCIGIREAAVLHVAPSFFHLHTRNAQPYTRRNGSCLDNRARFNLQISAACAAYNTLDCFCHVRHPSTGKHETRRLRAQVPHASAKRRTRTYQALRQRKGHLCVVCVAADALPTGQAASVRMRLCHCLPRLALVRFACRKLRTEHFTLSLFRCAGARAVPVCQAGDGRVSVRHRLPRLTLVGRTFPGRSGEPSYV